MIERPELREEIAELFDEAQTRGREWFVGASFIYRNPRRLTYAESRERGVRMVECVRSGRCLTDVAAEFGVSVHLVQMYCGRYKVSYRTRPPLSARWPVKLWRRNVVEAFRRGVPEKEIAVLVGKNPKQVRDFLWSMGVLVRPLPDENRDVRIIVALLDGASVRDVARQFDLTTDGAYKVLRRHGIRLGSKGRSGPAEVKRPPQYIPPAVIQMVNEWRRSQSVVTTDVRKTRRTRRDGARRP